MTSGGGLSTWGAKVPWWTREALQNERPVWAIGAPLTHTTAAAFGSSKPSGVDRHGPPLAGLHGRAVGWAVVGKRTAVGHSNRVIYTALTHNM